MKVLTYSPRFLCYSIAHTSSSNPVCFFADLQESLSENLFTEICRKSRALPIVAITGSESAAGSDKAMICDKSFMWLMF
jgi:hypothetical protein